MALPTPSGELIGRAEELARIESWLQRGEGLVTIIGPPGIGKTRLALEVAQRHPDTVLARMEAAHDLPTLEVALADAFGAPPLASPTTAGVRSVMAQRAPSLLVLLDADAVLEPLREILSGASGLTVLATSRTALELADEQVIELGPLSTRPSEKGPSDAARLIAAAHARSSGRGEAAIGEGELEPLARHAEGVPLALELAASALRRMGPSAAEHVLPGLIAKSVRQGTPAARALHRSWEALDEDARALLGCVAVLRGPFDAATARAAAGGARPLASVIEGLAELRAGSLLRTSDAHADALEVGHLVRELALARTPSEQLHAARRAALEHFAGREPVPGAPPADACILALAAALAEAEPVLAARALCRSRLDARSLEVQAQVLRSEALPADLRADLLRARSWAFFVSGQSAAALTAATEAIDAADRAGRPDLSGASAINAVSFAIDAGHIELAPALLERARASADSDRARLAVTTSEAYFLDQSGRADEALALLSPLASPQANGALYRLIPATIATMRAYAAAARGELHEALHLSRVATAASSVEGRPLPRYRLLEAIFMHARGDDGAEVLMREVTDALLVGEPRWAAAGLGHLAALEATQGQLERSTRTLARALALGAGMGSRAIRAALDWSSSVVEACGTSGAVRPFRAPSPAAWSRVLEALHPRVLAQRPRPSAPPPPRGVLSVDPQGAFFVTSSHETVHLGRRHSLRRLLAAIATARAEPGRWVSVPEALAAAWPDDRSSIPALKNRLRVAVATLRKMGLGDALEGHRHGYRLDPAIEVEILGGDPQRTISNPSGGTIT